jgi:hypothetical protein
MKPMGKVNALPDRNQPCRRFLYHTYREVTIAFNNRGPLSQPALHAAICVRGAIKVIEASTKTVPNFVQNGVLLAD